MPSFIDLEDRFILSPDPALSVVAGDPSWVTDGAGQLVLTQPAGESAHLDVELRLDPGTPLFPAAMGAHITSWNTTLDPSDIEILLNFRPDLLGTLQLGLHGDGALQDFWLAVVLNADRSWTLGIWQSARPQIGGAPPDIGLGIPNGQPSADHLDFATLSVVIAESATDTATITFDDFFIEGYGCTAVVDPGSIAGGSISGGSLRNLTRRIGGGGLVGQPLGG